MSSADLPQSSSRVRPSTWLQKLQELPAQLQRNPALAIPKLCGAECVPVMAALEAVETNQHTELKKALDGLATWAEQGLAFDAFGDSQQMARQLFAGIDHSIRAACFDRDPDHPFKAQSVQSAIVAFEQAGYGAATVADRAMWLPVSYTENRTQFDAFCQAASGYTSSAVGIVWDIVCQLSRFDFRQPQDNRTAGIKILLFGANELGSKGAIAQLEVELFDDKCGTFIPDVGRMGLTTAKPEFLTAMGDAWQVAGLTGCSGRWRVNACEMYSQIPWISGNSAQAATVCALWAAAGKVPQGGDEFTPPFYLDPYASISACIASGTGPAAALGPVGGINEKLEATRIRSDLVDRVIVAALQESADYQEHRDLRPDDPSTARTLGEAFSSLFRVQTALTFYRQEVINEWTKRWEPGTAAL
ncbi:MAG: hypothetical protein K1X74_17235 [Pirellulales bacterium]|nr:hypothetical protein [Pirellulales bacterium]